MSPVATAEPGQDQRSAGDGVLATWRELPPAAKVLLVGVFVSKLALNLGTTMAPLLGALLIAVSDNLLFWVKRSRP